jgi:hypothetical protein
MQNLLNGVIPGQEKRNRSELFQDYKCLLPNFVEQAECLEWAGIGFGEETTFLIQKSLKRLAE